MIIAIMLFSVITFSQKWADQKDTIFTIKNEYIVCKVTRTTPKNTFYTERWIGTFISNDKIKSISYSAGKPMTCYTTPIKSTTDTSVSLVLTKLDSLYLNVKDINLRLENHHSQFNTGMWISIVGTAFTAGSIILLSDKAIQKSTNNIPGYLVLGTGALLSISGLIIRLDSDKWFRKH